jgi:hypothetical protein
MSEELATPAVEVTETATPATEVTPVTPEPTPEQEETEKKARKSGLEKKIDKLTYKVSAAAAEAAHWKAEALKNQVQAQPEAQAPTAPQQGQFKTVEEYVDAITDFKLNQRDAAKRQTSQLDNFKSRASAFSKETPDYQEAMDDSRDVRLEAGITEALVESEVGPQLAYYLAKNPEEVTRLNNLSIHRRLVELGKLEDKVAVAPKKVAVTAAPNPVKPVTGAAPNAQKSIYEMSPSELMAHRNKNDKQRKGR